MTGNQHRSLKCSLMFALRVARQLLEGGDAAGARSMLRTYRDAYATAPASTRRRWKCGR